MSEDAFSLKIVMVGRRDVGKSALAIRFTQDTFTDAMPHVEVRTSFKQPVEVNKNTWEMEIVDIPGSLIKEFQYFQEMMVGYMLVYSVTDLTSFQEALTLANDLAKQAHVILVGNKSDLSDDRQVLTSVAQTAATKSRIHFIETSAKNNVNITEAFFDIARLIIGLSPDEPLHKIRHDSDKPGDKKASSNIWTFKNLAKSLRSVKRNDNTTSPFTEREFFKSPSPGTFPIPPNYSAVTPRNSAESTILSESRKKLSRKSWNRTDEGSDKRKSTQFAANWLKLPINDKPPPQFSEKASELNVASDPLVFLKSNTLENIMDLNEKNMEKQFKNLTEKLNELRNNGLKELSVEREENRKETKEYREKLLKDFSAEQSKLTKETSQLQLSQQKVINTLKTEKRDLIKEIEELNSALQKKQMKLQKLQAQNTKNQSEITALKTRT